MFIIRYILNSLHKYRYYHFDSPYNLIIYGIGGLKNKTVYIPSMYMFILIIVSLKLTGPLKIILESFIMQLLFVFSIILGYLSLKSEDINTLENKLSVKVPSMKLFLISSILYSLINYYTIFYKKNLTSENFKHLIFTADYVSSSLYCGFFFGRAMLYTKVYCKEIFFKNKL